MDLGRLLGNELTDEEMMTISQYFFSQDGILRINQTLWRIDDKVSGNGQDYSKHMPETWERIREILSVLILSKSVDFVPSKKDKRYISQLFFYKKDCSLPDFKRFVQDKFLIHNGNDEWLYFQESKIQEKYELMNNKKNQIQTKTLKELLHEWKQV